MTTPSNAEKNIRLARWRYPGQDWQISSTGAVTSFRPEQDLPGMEYSIWMFDISTQRDQSAVMMKLKRDHNIDIKKRTRSGRTVWEAVTRDGGATEHESLEILLWQVVEGLTK